VRAFNFFVTRLSKLQLNQKPTPINRLIFKEHSKSTTWPFRTAAVAAKGRIIQRFFRSSTLFQSSLPSRLNTSKRLNLLISLRFLPLRHQGKMRIIQPHSTPSTPLPHKSNHQLNKYPTTPCLITTIQPKLFYKPTTKIARASLCAAQPRAKRSISRFATEQTKLDGHDFRETRPIKELFSRKSKDL